MDFTIVKWKEFGQLNKKQQNSPKIGKLDSMENSVKRSVLWSVQMHSSCNVEKEK